MSAAFTLDTSGVVMVPVAIDSGSLKPTTQGRGFVRPTRWPDLSPFAQGYVEAAFEDIHRGGVLTVYGGSMSLAAGDAVFFGFRHLSPATLAALLKDCEARQRSMGPPVSARREQERGREFWGRRSRGFVPSFPPLTVALSDAGKVVFAATPAPLNASPSHGRMADEND